MLNTYNSMASTKICTVTAVDIRRAVCKCLSDTGEVLSEVRWVVPMGGTDGAGMSVHPVENSRVLVDTSSGAPFIVGAIPNDSYRSKKPEDKKLHRPNISRQMIGDERVEEADITDYSMLPMQDKDREILRGPGTPRDQRIGDNLMTSDGGGILGLLASGTAIIKSSPLAQMISSRFGDLVRIVSRNFEHFTDVDASYKSSIRGKLFTIREIFRNPTRSREERPSFVRYEGDVAWGETVGKGYADYTQDSFPTDVTIPTDVDQVVKEYTYNDSDEETSIYTQDISGNLARTIQVPGGPSTSHSEHQASFSTQQLGGGDTARWAINETEFFWESGADGSGVRVHGTAQSGMVIQSAGGAAKLTLNNDGTILIEGAIRHLTSALLRLTAEVTSRLLRL